MNLPLSLLAYVGIIAAAQLGILYLSSCSSLNATDCFIAGPLFVLLNKVRRLLCGKAPTQFPT